MLAVIDTITPAMLQGFAALLLAHTLADFVFQSNWMVRHKKDPPVLMLHILIVFAMSNAALGGAWQVATVIAVAHLVIDAVKTWGLPEDSRDSFFAFTIDQLAHLISLIVAILYWPNAITTGIWAQSAPLLVGPALIVSGLILSIIAGGHAVGMLTARFQAHIEDESLPDAGRMIGQLERGLIFLLIWVGHPAGVGFLVAAKSILRFDSARDQKIGEYVIIGTLASFAWALSIAYAVTALLEIIPKAP